MNNSAAIRHLKRSDPVLRNLIERLGPCRLAEECRREQFGVLADAIIHQQLAYKAAQSISRQFKLIYAQPNGRSAGRMPRPMELLQTPASKLRAAGISRQKQGYLRDLARKAVSGKLMLGRFSRMEDEEVIENLVQVKGIGRWTAEMFLIFCLQRPDVLPVDDLGLQFGFQQAYQLPRLPRAEQIQTVAQAWRPYRSIATWYLWKLRRETLASGDARRSA
jgi:DNA-3-methyladenine glycosylase II